MFDFSKLGDLSKLAGEAKQAQEKQEKLGREQVELLKKISDKIDLVVALLKNNK